MDLCGPTHTRVIIAGHAYILADDRATAGREWGEVKMPQQTTLRINIGDSNDLLTFTGQTDSFTIA